MKRSCVLANIGIKREDMKTSTRLCSVLFTFGSARVYSNDDESVRFVYLRTNIDTMYRSMTKSWQFCLVLWHWFCRTVFKSLHFSRTRNTSTTDIAAVLGIRSAILQFHTVSRIISNIFVLDQCALWLLQGLLDCLHFMRFEIQHCFPNCIFPASFVCNLHSTGC